MSRSVAKDELRKYLKDKKNTKRVNRKIAELRLAYSELATVCNFANKMLNIDRIHPHILPTQSSGRWSLTNPPLNNFPKKCINPDHGKQWHEKRIDCWGIKDCIQPDKGTFWVGGDADAIEARIFSLIVRDAKAVQAFNEGLDIHTPTCCYIFDLPYPTNSKNPHSGVEDVAWREQVEWNGKDDKRRGIAKNVRYGVGQYGLSPKAILLVKDLEEFNISRKKALEVAEKFWAFTKPQQDAKLEIMKQIRKDRVSRSLYGTRRVFFDGSDDTAKEGFNHIIQNTVVELTNEKHIAMRSKWPDSYHVQNSHDGFYQAFPDYYDPQIILREMNELLYQKMSYNNLEVDITWTLKLVAPS